MALAHPIALLFAASVVGSTAAAIIMWPAPAYHPSRRSVTRSSSWTARGGCAASLVDAADRALYAAKTGGRNRVEVAALPAAISS